MHFSQFCADFSKKTKSVKAIYMLYLKVLITLFLKMIWFIGVWATIHEILFIYFLSFVSNIRFWFWKYSKFISILSSFGLFWSVKYLNFWEKVPIWTAHQTFLESRHPEVTKNLYHGLSIRRSQIPNFLGSRTLKSLSPHSSFICRLMFSIIQIIYILEKIKHLTYS